MKKYGTAPVEIASDVIIDNSEMYFYQYLPILIPEVGFEVPTPLLKLVDIIWKCMEDYKKLRPNTPFPYIYITAKCLYVPKGGNLNRMGWHCDGFMSEDINYIWSDCVPTEYITGDFDLIQDHEKSIEQMNNLFYSEKGICTTKYNSIYRLDETVVHRCGYNQEDFLLRHFVKLSFSTEKYNLKGNSHNYLLDYEWDMFDRGVARNHPSK